jgi:tRNA(fMet)-specific endonuclease VapC
LNLRVLDYDRDDALEAGRVRALLASQGRPIGPYDTLIAGQALRHGLVLVTANTREFERVPGLVCEDWSR